MGKNFTILRANPEQLVTMARSSLLWKTSNMQSPQELRFHSLYKMVSSHFSLRLWTKKDLMCPIFWLSIKSKLTISRKAIILQKEQTLTSLWQQNLWLRHLKDLVVKHLTQETTVYLRALSTGISSKSALWHQPIKQENPYSNVSQNLSQWLTLLNAIKLTYATQLLSRPTKISLSSHTWQRLKWRPSTWSLSPQGPPCRKRQWENITTHLPKLTLSSRTRAIGNM